MKTIGTGWMLGLVAAALAAGCGREARDVFQGYAEADYVDVATAEPGQLETLGAAKGDAIAAGAPLFVLEAAREAAALRQAQEQLAAARAQLQDLRQGKRPPELDVVRAQLEQARAEATRAAAERERDAAQFASGGIAQAQLDRSQAAADAAAARVRELERQLDVAQLPARADQIAAQEAQAAAAQAAVDQAAWRLGQKTVAAPVAGQIFDVLYQPGEWIAAGRPVVRLLPPGNVKIRFFVPETALAALAVGQALVVRRDGCADEIPANITYISPEAEYTPPIIYSNETRSKLVFMVEAKPLDGANLHPGQPLEVALR
ncbi:MAG: HlyD family secretion protein [Kiritimatiellia bacterium]